jgi:hypothetical protein
MDKAREIATLARSIELQSIASSNLKAVGYSEQHKLFVAQFPGGAKWAYSGVEPDEYERFKKAPSLGSFFAKHIKAKTGVPVPEEKKSV